MTVPISGTAPVPRDDEPATELLPPAAVPVPPGADPDNISAWEDGARLVWSTPAPLPERLASYDIRLVASQRLDGTIVRDDAEDGPLVYLSSEDYSVDDARLIAKALLAAADLADQWTGSSVADGLLSAAKAAVMDAYTAFRDMPGNAGDYLRAALDSIADAEAVTR